jgi:hypothetical protein
MKPVFLFALLALAGYFGWQLFHEFRDRMQPVPDQTEAANAIPIPATAPSSPAAKPPQTTAPPSSLAPPGVYYAGERISIKNETGVKALHPGEEVKLMYRYKDGSMLVTNGRHEFVVKAAALTKDREQAARAPAR